MNLTSLQNTLTMSSREIAELCDKEHRHVKRDIDVMTEQLEIDASKFGHIYTDSQNRQQTEYLLHKFMEQTPSGANLLKNQDFVCVPQNCGTQKASGQRG